MADLLPPNAHRVRMSTASKINLRIERVSKENLLTYQGADKDDIEERLKALDKEWDTERVLEANASGIIFISVLLGYYVTPWFFLLAGVVSFFLLQHALMGWCPPLPVIRKLGIRTQSEIYAEKAALKLISGYKRQ